MKLRALTEYIGVLPPGFLVGLLGPLGILRILGLAQFDRVRRSGSGLEFPHPWSSLLFLPRRSIYLLMTRPATGSMVDLPLLVDFLAMMKLGPLMTFSPMVSFPPAVGFQSMTKSLVNFPGHLILADRLLSPNHLRVHQEPLVQYAMVQPGLRCRLGWGWGRHWHWKLVEEKPMLKEVRKDLGQ